MVSGSVPPEVSGFHWGLGTNSPRMVGVGATVQPKHPRGSSLTHQARPALVSPTSVERGEGSSFLNTLSDASGSECDRSILAITALIILSEPKQQNTPFLVLFPVEGTELEHRTWLLLLITITTI